MTRIGKQLLLCAMIWLAGASQGGAFALLGQFPAWQTANYSGALLDYNFLGDIGGPQRPNEGFRWNLPVITYAFDKTFINYFGARGMAEIDKAIAVFNNLPAMTQIRHDSTFFYINGQRVPFDTAHINGLAQNLGLVDLKSWAMVLLIEELGLAEAERWVWTLAGRATFTNPAQTNYSVFHLNFDPITITPSSYVNGVLYTFQIVETANPLRAEALEVPASPLDFSFSSVSGGAFSLAPGRFYSGLTHDDVGGLRWLYNTNNLAIENLNTNVVAGSPLRGGSPWAPFFASTNVFAVGTNFVFSTNVLVRQALRPGQNKLTFKRVAFDSLLGELFTPITNRYTDTYFTNGSTVIQPVQRVITFPDIVFTAERLGLGGNLVPALSARSGTVNWQNNDAVNGQDIEVDGGPGVIEGPIFIRFTDQLPFFTTFGTIFFLNPIVNEPGLPSFPPFTSSVIWGSFDGTTDEPFIYPVYGDITIDDIQRIVAGGGN